jgi:hypothetical protein
MYESVGYNFCAAFFLYMMRSGLVSFWKGRGDEFMYNDIAFLLLQDILDKFRT